MDIKIRARLSAYSKVDSLSKVELPIPSAEDAGSVIGVGDTGKYTLFSTVTNNDVDSLFDGMQTDRIVTKDEIDELFNKTERNVTSVTKSDIDSLFEKEDDINAVNRTEIDSLFNSVEKPEAINKDHIDTLFSNPDEPETVGTVTFAEIDSLFR